MRIILLHVVVGLEEHLRRLNIRWAFVPADSLSGSMTLFLRLPTAILPSGIVAVSVQDLMDTLTAYAEALGYLLKGPTLLPEPGNGWVVSGIDPRVRVGMFEEESTPVVPANNIQSLIDLGVGREDEIILLRQAR